MIKNLLLASLSALLFMVSMLAASLIRNSELSHRLERVVAENENLESELAAVKNALDLDSVIDVDFDVNKWLRGNGLLRDEE